MTTVYISLSPAVKQWSRCKAYFKNQYGRGVKDGIVLCKFVRSESTTHEIITVQAQDTSLVSENDCPSIECLL